MKEKIFLSNTQTTNKKGLITHKMSYQRKKLIN